jgi:hypothetical protein
MKLIGTGNKIKVVNGMINKTILILTMIINRLNMKAIIMIILGGGLPIKENPLTGMTYGPGIQIGTSGFISILSTELLGA